MIDAKRNTNKYVLINCFSTLLAFGCAVAVILFVALFALSGGAGASAQTISTLNFVFPYGLLILFVTTVLSWELIFLKKYSAAMWFGFSPTVFLFLTLMSVIAR